MPNYLFYRDHLESIESDDQEKHQKIIDLMTEGMHLVRKKSGENVRISHAKAFGLLQGTLVIEDNLRLEPAQGLLTQPGTHQFLSASPQRQVRSRTTLRSIPPATQRLGCLP